MVTSPLDDLHRVAVELGALGLAEHAARIGKAIAELAPTTLPAVGDDTVEPLIYQALVDEDDT